jgi:hypothetical protein
MRKRLRKKIKILKMAKDSFFIGGMKKKRKPQKESDEEDENIDDMNLEHEREESEEEIQETPAQKRLRLAKDYLSKIQQDVDDGICPFDCRYYGRRN